jgi:diaminohydroxyphosphoribosylaminopyrimidine deaminase / 5-amino-6-(5-phosphoribosylamino)uracil reductase
MHKETHEKYMNLCLQLARKAFGNTYPNPLVGCVIVCNDTVIGQGFHEQAGLPHAEVNAIASVANKALLSQSTLYVNLEPCAHFGKTPPCSDAIIAHNIPRVVVGCTDSFHEVSGKGIEKMRAAGIDVLVGVCQDASRQLNARFFTFHEKKRPYIILKWAQTQDGFIDIASDLKIDRKGLWITDEICKKQVHEWRAQEQAILVGTIAAEIDNPELTVRLVEGKNPLRLVIDLQNRLPHDLHVKDGSTPTIIYSAAHVPSRHNLEFVHIKTVENLWNEIFADLYNRNIQSLFVEGGALVLHDLIEKNVWDEMRVFTGPGSFGRGVAGPVIMQKPESTEKMGNSELSFYYNNLL